MQVHAITPALAHVSREENLFVRKVWASGKPHEFVAEFTVDGAHPYLYENPAIANHVSGTTFIDTARQLLKAISHIFYEVPMDNRFVLHEVSIQFVRWAKIGVPIRVVVSVACEGGEKNPKAKRTFRLASRFEQEGRRVSEARSSFTTLSRRLEERLMSRQYAEAPLD